MDFKTLAKQWQNGELPDTDLTPEQRRVFGLIASGWGDERAYEAAGLDFVLGVKSCTELGRSRIGYQVEQRESRETDEFIEIPWILSAQNADRDGDVVMQDGWILDDYRKNPVLYWGHARGSESESSEPIGIVANLGKAQSDKGHPALGGVVRITKLSDRGARIGRLAAGRVINAGSVGFMPKTIKRIEDDEERERIGVGRFGVVFEKQEMLEFSLCGVPMHPSALQRAIEAKSITDDDAQFAKALTDPTEKEWEKWARHRNRRWVSMSIKDNGESTPGVAPAASEPSATDNGSTTLLLTWPPPGAPPPGAPVYPWHTVTGTTLSSDDQLKKAMESFSATVERLATKITAAVDKFTAAATSFGDLAAGVQTPQGEPAEPGAPSVDDSADDDKFRAIRESLEALVAQLEPGSNSED